MKKLTALICSILAGYVCYVTFIWFVWLAYFLMTGYALLMMICGVGLGTCALYRRVYKGLFKREVRNESV